VAQILELQPTRAGAGDVFYLEQGGDVVLRLFMMTHFKGTATVTIARVEGDTLMMVTDYPHFDASGIGTLVVPVFKFSPGHYTLSTTPQVGAESPSSVYMF
jgi:hypothetical protein